MTGWGGRWGRTGTGAPVRVDRSVARVAGQSGRHTSHTEGSPRNCSDTHSHAGPAWDTYAQLDTSIHTPSYTRLYRQNQNHLRHPLSNHCLFLHISSSLWITLITTITKVLSGIIGGDHIHTQTQNLVVKWWLLNRHNMNLTQKKTLSRRTHTHSLEHLHRDRRRETI